MYRGLYGVDQRPSESDNRTSINFKVQSRSTVHILRFFREFPKKKIAIEAALTTALRLGTRECKMSNDPDPYKKPCGGVRSKLYIYYIQGG